MKIEPGEFVAVIGKIGSGKSSLLNAIIGNMKKTKGFLGIKGSIAYIPQEAFLINASLKENILFGKEFDQEKYEEVVKICELIEDFNILPAGDETEIGERGINLSGGQKQRVSIARAVYSDSDIYLVDDCLSALDASVGANILKNVFFSFLREKTRLMNTHHYHFLDEVDKVIVMESGQIKASGKYSEVKLTQEYQKLVKVKKLQEKKNSKNNRKNEKKGNKTRNSSKNLPHLLQLKNKICFFSHESNLEETLLPLYGHFP